MYKTTQGITTSLSEELLVASGYRSTETPQGLCFLLIFIGEWLGTRSYFLFACPPATDALKPVILIL